MPNRYHVVVIGGGFSGMALAIHLVRGGRRPLPPAILRAVPGRLDRQLHEPELPDA